MISYKNILAVGAHPDDVELGCAGTLLNLQEQGAHIDIVVARDDNAPKPSVWRTREKMLAEYQASERLFGIKFNILENPVTEDGRPVLEWNSKTVEQMDEVVNSKQYDLVITHSPGDHHQDHINTFNIVNSSLRRYRGEFWVMEESPYANRNTQFRPNIFVDITKHIDKKIELITCYDSYFNQTLLNNIKGLNAFRGNMLGVEYAESFECRYRCII